MREQQSDDGWLSIWVFGTLTLMRIFAPAVATLIVVAPYTFALLWVGETAHRFGGDIGALIVLVAFLIATALPLAMAAASVMGVADELLPGDGLRAR